MQTIRATFVLSVLLVVGFVLYAATDMILAFVEQALTFALLSARVCGGLLAFVVLVACLWLLLRQRYEHARQRDGAFALREYWLEPLPRRVLNWLAGRPSARAVLDMNANMSHAAVVHDAIYSVEPACGWELQRTYMSDVERTRRSQAVVTGDGVKGLPWFGGGGERGGIPNAATGRLLAGAYDRQAKPTTITQPTAPPQLSALPASLTAAAAVSAAQPASIVMGQTDAGELVRWEPASTPHLRLHGASRGAGKTNAVQVILAGALATGAHGVVFDPAHLKDWGDFAHCAELVDADPSVLADGAARLLTIYHNRARQLAQAGARDISQMARPPKRIIVVIAEFGAQCELARGEGMLSALETPLLQLARKAGAAGIHLLLEDQVVDRWPRGMAANAAPVIGRMPAYAGQACGYIGRGGVTTETFDSYQFAFAGHLFRTPHMQPALPALLAGLPAPQQLVMLTPPYAAADGAAAGVRAGVRGGVFAGVSPEVAPPPPAPANAANTPPADLGKWYDFIFDYMARDVGRGLWQQPPEGVRALARAMSAAETGNESSEDRYVGIASKTTQRIRESARLSNGERLGTDIATPTGGA